MRNYIFLCFMIIGFAESSQDNRQNKKFSFKTLETAILLIFQQLSSTITPFHFALKSMSEPIIDRNKCCISKLRMNFYCTCKEYKQAICFVRYIYM